MHLLPELASHHAVSIPELLVSRDENKHGNTSGSSAILFPLVSFTVVAPGPIKDSEVTRRIFNHGVTALRALAAKQGWRNSGAGCTGFRQRAGGYVEHCRPGSRPQARHH